MRWNRYLNKTTTERPKGQDKTQEQNLKKNLFGNLKSFFRQTFGHNLDTPQTQMPRFKTKFPLLLSNTKFSMKLKCKTQLAIKKEENAGIKRTAAFPLLHFLAMLPFHTNAMFYLNPTNLSAK